VVNAAWSRAFIVAANARSVSATCFFSSALVSRWALAAAASISNATHNKEIHLKRIGHAFSFGQDIAILSWWLFPDNRQLRRLRNGSIKNP
jgi:hypothetical protein